jgi:transposase
MMKKKVEIFTRRSFSEEFKKQCVLDYEAGRFTVLELSKLHNVSFPIIYRWIYRYSAYNKRKIKVVEMTESSDRKIKDLYKRIEELERIVGQKQLNIDFLEKMIELTKEQYGIDIKKNSNTPPSIGSEKTSKS